MGPYRLSLVSRACCIYPLTFLEFAYSEEVSTLTVGHVSEVNIKGDSDRVP